MKHWPVLRTNYSIPNDAKADRIGESTGACGESTGDVYSSYEMRETDTCIIEIHVICRDRISAGSQDIG